MLILICLPAIFSSPLLPELLGAVRELGPQLLQTVVTGGGGGVGGGGGGGVIAVDPGIGTTTGVTTLPATMVSTPVMATMAPGIALGILKALLVGRLLLALQHHS